MDFFWISLGSQVYNIMVVTQCSGESQAQFSLTTMKNSKPAEVYTGFSRGYRYFNPFCFIRFVRSLKEWGAMSWIEISVLITLLTKNRPCEMYYVL